MTDILNNFSPIIQFIFSTSLGAIVGYFVKYFLDKKQSIHSALHSKKREMYSEFVRILTSIIYNAGKNEQEKSKNITKAVEELKKFYIDFLVYSSPKFINAFGDFMQYLYLGGQDTKKTLKLLSQVVKALRKEVGLSNRGLGLSGIKIFRSIFNDYKDVTQIKLNKSLSEFLRLNKVNKQLETKE